MAVDTVIRQLVGHDSPCCIVEQDVQSVGRVADLLGHSRDRGPVRQVAVDPLCLVCLVLSQFLSYRLLCSLYDLLGQREDIDLLDVVLEKGVACSIADALRDVDQHGSIDTSGACGYPPLILR